MALIEMHTYINNNPYRQHDPESNTYFEPGEPKLAQPTEWLKKQTFITQLPDKSLEATAAQTQAIADKAAAALKSNAPILPGTKGK